LPVNYYLSSKTIPMFVSNIIPIEDIVISEEVVKTNFACDLKKCKGACCTVESEYGAPLRKEEIEIINGIIDAVKKYLPKIHVDEIDKKGFYDTIKNKLMTRSINKKACVFVFYENGIAKCSIEKAYLNGESDFRKPISCHLFPIRVTNFGGDILRYEKFEQCSPALKNGDEKNIKMVEFCEESLTRLYGERWYSNLMEVIGK
jgi:hypothetical protein